MLPAADRLSYNPIVDHLKRFFNGLVRRAFGQLGILDTPIVEHVTTVLATFARADRLYRLESSAGRHIDSIVAMRDEFEGSAALSPGGVQRKRDLSQYMGDYALFMSGMFRAHVERGGFLDYYLSEGSRSYRDVSALDLALYRSRYFVFEELANRFELYSGALDYLRKAGFTPAEQENVFAGFTRHIDGWIRVGISRN